ncbi:hypothetical protein [Carboxylicivirga linearis]|uniref:Uncharacterized protein n=1 Tax=Carboxylicivirga linearis TaxID=1628157 RepID=A0ABS5JTD1_9BACT|nr:hypothetical protein [Carboxylicivirga linearis]MBS2098060.1 hypothetical protein [Carboxylicivirga linearis]
MKLQIKLSAYLIMSLFAFSTYSCSEDDPESCKTPDQDIGTCSADDITVCCDDEGSCYYIYQGTNYDDVTDIATVCASASTIDINSIKIQLDAFTSQLIDEARSAAICK